MYTIRAPKEKMQILVYRICIYIHPEVSTLIAWVYLNVLLIARSAWYTVAVSPFVVNFLRGIFGTAFPFHFRNFSENSLFCDLFIFAFVPFLVQRTGTREKSILNNLIVGASVWKDSTSDSFYNWIRIWDSCFSFSRSLYSSLDLLKRGWSGLSNCSIYFLFCYLEKKELSISDSESNSFFPTILRNEIVCFLVCGLQQLNGYNSKQKISYTSNISKKKKNERCSK